MNDNALPLKVYQETKQALDFDPAELAPQFPEMEPWGLEEKYPPRIGELISELTVKLALSPEYFLALQHLASYDINPAHLEQAAQYFAQVAASERSTEDEQIQEDAQASGHVEPSTGVTVSKADPERSGGLGQEREDRDGEGGKAQPVSRQRRKKVDLGE